MTPALRLTTLLLEVSKPVLAKLYCADNLPRSNSPQRRRRRDGSLLIKDLALRPLE